jgi:hypothetical protein
MKTQLIIKFGIILSLFGCRQSSDKVDKKEILITKDKIINTLARDMSNIPDTSNQYIYDFMKVVISDQKLDLSCGLTIEPEQSCDLQDDKMFLKRLLIEKLKPKIKTGDWRNTTITFNELPKRLTSVDIDDMLLQKEKLKSFTWDNSRLGFDISNKRNWYCFSRPLFSKDRKTVLMMIRNLCPGLCGTSWTVMFVYENNKWTSKTGNQWIH